MDRWKGSFLEKLHKAQAQWAKQFEDTLDQAVVPAFDDLAGFLGDNGFRTSTPLADAGRRSFKFELAENAYLLVIFQSSGVGGFELRWETSMPGAEPILERSVAQVPDIDKGWARDQFQAGLDRFVTLLADKTAAEPCAELTAV